MKMQESSNGSGVELPYVYNKRRVDLAVSHHGLRNSLTLSDSPFIHSALQFATGDISNRYLEFPALHRVSRVPYLPFF